jgi:cytosine deaminase
MLEVAHMGLHVAQMTGTDQILQMFEAVTVNGAKALGLKDYGLERGCRADLVILQAKNVHEALRLKPARLVVVRGGKVIASTPPVVSRVELEDGVVEVDFLH